MQMHHFSTFYDVFSSAKLQWPHYLPFLQTMCHAIQVYHLDEAICFSVQNSNRMKTRILLMSAFLTGIPTEKKLRNVIFSFAVKISVRKTVGIRNLPEIRPQFKSEKQSALPTRYL